MNEKRHSQDFYYPFKSTGVLYIKSSDWTESVNTVAEVKFRIKR